VILVAVARAGDHQVKLRQVKSRRPIALPVRAVRVAALLARSIAVIMWPRLTGMLFTGPSPEAMARHRLIVAQSGGAELIVNFDPYQSHWRDYVPPMTLLETCWQMRRGVEPRTNSR